MSDRYEVDGNLASWSDVQRQRQWMGILIGNGASRAVWEPFQYPSLYDKATSEDIEHPLSDADKSVFDALGTRNFESVLAALSTAEIVANALGQDTSVIMERYESVQTALVEAVDAVHVRWERIPREVLTKIALTLREYRFVYSTNYDLLVYWSIMSVEAEGFKDYFWGVEQAFDPTNTEIWDKEATNVLYLHGALHLYHLPWGKTLKRRREPFVNLLDLFKIPHEEGAIPLFVSEGTSEDKLASIYRSDYLAFAHQQFRQHYGPLVVFGHSLGGSDKHLVDAIKGWGHRHVAISMVPRPATGVVARKHELLDRLPEAELCFFDATTHPLGDPSLKIREAEGNDS